MERYSFSTIAKKRTSSSLACFVGLIVAFAMVSCNEIIEKDISDEVVEMVIPTKNDTLLTNQIHFKWLKMDGADFYNLQMVKPTFSDIQQFVLDSNIAGNESYQIVSPGQYTFKIRGENGAYQSKYTEPFTIYVDSVSDLSAQFVSLISPADEIYSNGTADIAIAWQNLFSADKYEYILKSGASFETGSTIDQNLDIAGLSYTISADNLTAENIYYWGIKGVNTTSSSAYSYRKIYVDLTRPNTPTLIAPADMTTVDVDEEITLKWNTGTDPGTVHSAVSSTVEISTTATFDAVSIVSGITVDSLNYTFAATGDYWWRVKTEDAVGNVSEFYSVERKISVE